MNFDFRKKRTKLPKLGSGGGGLGNSGNARKKTFFSIDLFPNGESDGDSDDKEEYDNDKDVSCVAELQRSIFTKDDSGTPKLTKQFES